MAAILWRRAELSWREYNPAEIVRPTLLINARRARANIRTMAARAAAGNTRFRPHFKTHQQPEIGEWFREAGVRAITVSSLDMAAFFADQGWSDITVAFPVNHREIDLINDLAGRINLNLMPVMPESVDYLAHHLTAPVDIWLKIDCGYQRTGIALADRPAILAMVERVSRSKNMTLSGLLTHAGNTYGASKERIVAIGDKVTTDMRALRDFLGEKGYSGLQISVGDTPGCSLADRFDEVDEIRPGNFIFYDLMQLEMGVCEATDLALAVACPVVAKHEDRQTAVIYGGAVHLSREVLNMGDEGVGFGRIALLGERGWGEILPQARLKSVSQEHGIISASPALLEQLKIGDLVAVLPVHSCLAADILPPGQIIGNDAGAMTDNRQLATDN